MSQRSTSPLSRSTVRRTLQRFWGVTRTQPLIVFLSVFSSAGYIILLTFANTYVTRWKTPTKPMRSWDSRLRAFPQTKKTRTNCNKTAGRRRKRGCPAAFRIALA